MPTISLSVSLRSHLRSSGSSLSSYAVNNFDPSLVFDFEQNYYRTGGTDSTLSSSVTHTRASSATMTNSSGNIVTVGNNVARVGHHIYNGNAWVNEGVLHESEARTNMVTYSEDFSTDWTLFNTTQSIATGVTSPDGSENVTQLKETAVTGSLQVYFLQSIATTWTVSVYIKQLTASRWVQLRPWGVGNGKAYATFSPSDGTLTDSGGTNLVSTSTEDVGNGWYRVSLTSNIALVGGDGTSIAITNSSTGEVSARTGDSTAGVYIYGAQLEEASTPSSYIPTSGSTVTRAADTLTVPAANMPYPETVYTSGELVTNGTFDSNINDWTLSDANGTIVWDASGAISLTGGSGTVYASQPFTTVSGGLYELKITGPSSGNIHLAVGTSENNQSLLYAAVTGTRTFTFIASSTTTHVTFREFSGTGPTLVSNISIKEFNPLYVSIQMDGRMTYADNSTTTANSDVGGEVTFFRWRLSNSDWLGSMVNAKSPKVGQVNFRQKYSGAVDFTQTAEDYYNYANSPVSFNIASRHGSTFINGATDGTALTANTTPKGLPNLSATNLNLGYRFMGTIGKFRVWSDDLTDTGIATASAPSTEPSLQLTFDGSSTSSFTVLDWSE